MHSKEKTYLSLFLEVARHISSTLEIDKVLDLIVKKVAEVIGVEAATIRLLDPSGKKLYLAAAYGLSKEYLNRGPVDAEKSIAEALSGNPVAIFDAVHDPRVAYSEAVRKEGIKSILAVPIQIRGRVIGVLRLLSRKPRLFTDDEIDFATALAEQCGIAIENARMYEAQRKQLRYFETLNEIGKALNSIRDLNEILNLIVTKLPEVMNLKGCTIRLLDLSGQKLELVASYGLSKEYLSRGSIDDELSTHQALQGEPVIIYDATTDPRIRYQEEAKKEGIASILAVPIIVHNRIIGVLRLHTAKPRHFDEAEINFVMAVAEQSGIAIQNALYYKKINNILTQLEEEHKFLGTVIDSLAAGLVVIDSKKHLAMVNKRILEEHGFKYEETIGRKCYEVLKTCRRDLCPLEKVRQKKEPASYITSLKAGNEEKHYEVTLSPVIGSSGEVEHFIEIVRDITAQLKLQQEQMERERLEGVLQLARTVAHELNTPMFAALGTAQLALSDLKEDDPIYEDLQIIVRNLKKMAELTKKMAHITHYETKDYVGDVKILDLEKAADGGQKK
ncbi:MAG TPA: GAF domain-containing protein [Thermodesulfatator atlanticus]|uniref:histidine kinase n=1 Tax=Thermodesulfatator atlanticus TaxID=501497 RepID=A0A7V5P198_9BACT|nr:GAF domain-containing protein [Thermodesulfatator atlanticus]